MIRLVQRRLIVPRGDTGTFSIPILAGKDSGDVSIFTIFDPLTHRKIFEKVMENSDGILKMDLTHGDTVNLPVGEYVWDIKFYSDPIFVDEKLVSGTEVDSYYSAFSLPFCEIRETGDNLLMADDTPNAKLMPDQINYIDASIIEIHNSMNTAIDSASEAQTHASTASASASAAGISAEAASSSASAAEVAEQAATSAAESASQSASAAAASAAQIEADLETKANVADLSDVAFSGSYNDLTNVPTNVSSFTNDAGYLTEHQDISGKANSADLATVATSGSYNDLSNKPYIPNKVSDLTDDSGHYTKPVAGIPASDLEETYLTSFTETDPTVPSWAKQAQKPTYTAQEVGALPNTTYIPNKVSDLQNDAGYLTEHQDISGKADKSEIPTSVSELENDAGYITGYTETDPTVPAWAKASTKPVYTAAEVGAPTIGEMNTAIGNAIGNIHQFGIEVVQSLPTTGIKEHTVYFVSKTGETNDVYDEYIRVNNAWEMIGNTQIDLSNYVQKTDYANADTAGVVKISDTGTHGIGRLQDIDANNQLYYTGEITIQAASNGQIKASSGQFNPITPATQNRSVFYGLAKAAGDTTQSQSSNAVGTYTAQAKTAIQTMLDVPAKADIPTNLSDLTDDVGYITTHQDISGKADKTDTVLLTTLSRGRANNTTAGEGSFAFGSGVTASGSYSHAEGQGATASGAQAHAEGGGAVASNTAAHAEGLGTKAQGPGSHAEGGGTTASTTYAHAEGSGTTASGEAAHSEGSSTVASATNAHAEGSGTRATESGAHSEGSSTRATGPSSHAENTGTRAEGFASHAEGAYTYAIGDYSHAEGGNSRAVGVYSHAENNSQAIGMYSHAEGILTVANGAAQHVSGLFNVADNYDNWNEWTANTSYSVGDKVKITTTSNEETTVTGYRCITANNDASFTSAKWEPWIQMNFAEIIGNGSNPNACSNAFALDWNGNGHYMGDIYIGANADSTGGERLFNGLEVVRLI